MAIGDTAPAAVPNVILSEHVLLIEIIFVPSAAAAVPAPQKLRERKAGIRIDEIHDRGIQLVCIDMTAIDKRELMQRDQARAGDGPPGSGRGYSHTRRRQDAALKRSLQFGIRPRERAKVAYPVRVVRDVHEDIDDLAIR